MLNQPLWFVSLSSLFSSFSSSSEFTFTPSLPVPEESKPEPVEHVETFQISLTPDSADTTDTTMIMLDEVVTTEGLYCHSETIGREIITGKICSYPNIHRYVAFVTYSTIVSHNKCRYGERIMYFLYGKNTPKSRHTVGCSTCLRPCVAKQYPIPTIHMVKELCIPYIVKTQCMILFFS